MNHGDVITVTIRDPYKLKIYHLENVIAWAHEKIAQLKALEK